MHIEARRSLFNGVFVVGFVHDACIEARRSLFNGVSVVRFYPDVRMDAGMTTDAGCVLIE